jgi:hypothetical protein
MEIMCLQIRQSRTQQTTLVQKSTRKTTTSTTRVSRTISCILMRSTFRKWTCLTKMESTREEMMISKQWRSLTSTTKRLSTTKRTMCSHMNSSRMTPSPHSLNIKTPFIASASWIKNPLTPSSVEMAMIKHLFGRSLQPPKNLSQFHPQSNRLMRR